MDLTSFLILMTNVILSVGMIAIALWLFIPKAFSYIKKWNFTGNQWNFSGGIFCFFIAFSFLSFGGIELVCNTLKIEQYFSSGYEKLLVFLAITFFLLYLLIPRALTSFQKWRSTKKSSDFSIFILFVFTSIYSMILAYLLYLPVFLR